MEVAKKDLEELAITLGTALERLTNKTHKAAPNNWGKTLWLRLIGYQV